MTKYRFEDDYSESRFDLIIKVALHLEVLLLCLFSFLFMTGGIKG